jgi:hypothetical protein
MEFKVTLGSGLNNFLMAENRVEIKSLNLNSNSLMILVLLLFIILIAVTFRIPLMMALLT